jgi:nucleotide-binding universal stress UspA family protein
VLGSVGEGLVSGGPCPIVVAPHGFAQQPTGSIATVVAGFDGSPESREALRMANVVAQATGATLRPVAVTHRPRLARREHGEPTPRAREELQARLKAALEELGVQADGSVVDGEPAERLAEAAADADLLVLGARGYGPHHHVLVGSVSSKLMRTSACPVLVLPRPGPDEADDGGG